MDRNRKLNTIVLEKLIPQGRENAIQRRTLVGLIGMSDREMRMAIHEARADGLPILNDSDGRGYWISDDHKEIDRWLRQETARAKKILRATLKIRRIVNAGWE